MRSVGRRRAWVVAGAVSLAGCLSVPDPRGARSASRHYEVRADCDDRALARTVGEWAERDHEILEEYFATEVSAELPLVVCESPHQFARLRRMATGDAPAVGFYSCFPAFAVISGTHAPMQQVLAHELVHHFVHEILPEAPFWIDEGLACELSHTHAEGSDSELYVPTFRGCPLIEVSRLSNEEVARHVRGLASWQSDDVSEAWTRSQVAAAVLRFGMETRGWKDLRAAASFAPDAHDFLYRLRNAPTHDRFPPLVRPAV